MKKVFIILGFLVLLALGFSLFYLPALSRYRELRQQEDRLTTRLQTVEQQIQELQKERDLLKNDITYIEKVIREELGLVRPGEILYKLVPQKEEPQKTVVEQMPEGPAPFATGEGSTAPAAPAPKPAAPEKPAA